MAQSGIFSLVHTRFNLGLEAMGGLLAGLFLLGLVLARQRQSDRALFGAPLAYTEDLLEDGFYYRTTFFNWHPRALHGCLAQERGKSTPLVALLPSHH